MATFTKRGKKWQAQVSIGETRTAKTFTTKLQAELWAEQKEAELQGLASGRRTLYQLMEAYLEDVVPKKRGKRWDTNRIRRFMDELSFVKRPLDEIRPEDWQKWRNTRLKAVQPATVRRDMNLASAVYQYAILELRWATTNPVRLVKRPEDAKSRKQRIDDTQIEAILKALDFDNQGRRARDRVGLAFQFAIETAMRAGEIVNLTWEHVHPKHVHLPLTKNSQSRDVPLSPKAREIIETLRPLRKHLGEHVFSLTSQTLDVHFREARNKAELGFIRFHDTRREGTSRLAKKLPVELLAKVTGHTDLRILLKTYYAPVMSEVADML
jgi:integrase